jgi:hypothetical protein
MSSARMMNDVGGRAYGLICVSVQALGNEGRSASFYRHSNELSSSIKDKYIFTTSTAGYFAGMAVLCEVLGQMETFRCTKENDYPSKNTNTNTSTCTSKSDT